MMSSTVLACLVLLSATLHSVSDTTLCCCVTRPVAVPNRLPTELMSGCSRTVAACTELLNHSAPWQTTVIRLQVCCAGLTL
jgi:hypothetical protein